MIHTFFAVASGEVCATSARSLPAELRSQPSVASSRDPRVSSAGSSAASRVRRRQTNGQSLIRRTVGPSMLRPVRLCDRVSRQSNLRSRLDPSPCSRDQRLGPATRPVRSRRPRARDSQRLRAVAARLRRRKRDERRRSRDETALDAVEAPFRRFSAHSPKVGHCHAEIAADSTRRNGSSGYV